MGTFEKLFERATGHSPFGYQRRLAEGPWPDLLDIPTGLGKTAAVTLAWLHKRQQEDEGTPRRLVWCLPMRVLVEQTQTGIRNWLQQCDMLGEPGEGRVSVHVLMGGETDARRPRWPIHPDENAIIIGTQDMLLSRALMRGYGMSRYQWPVHFALLHNDALWVFDEVQLMGPAVATSAQLEGFRRNSEMSPAKSCRSLWLSATLNRDWLDTVNLRPHLPEMQQLRLSSEEAYSDAVRKRREAPKTLNYAETRLTEEHTKKSGVEAYAAALASEVLERHVAAGDTLIVINTVERAQAVFDALRREAPEINTMLVHARFRPHERRAIEAALRENGAEGRLIVTTQAIEAGVDISSHRLFSELAPWSSMVQRFGRCNRYGEVADAQVCWIDIEASPATAAPYEPDSLAAARGKLDTLQSASPANLPATDESIQRDLVLRQRDFLQLFNTDPDLSGFDVDVSPYIRDTGTAQLQVFWREFGEDIQSQPPPQRDELCPVSIAQIRTHLGRNTRTALIWDHLSERWVPRSGNEVRPGMVLLLDNKQGGYDPQRGFIAGLKSRVEPLPQESATANDSYDGEPGTVLGQFVPLQQHLTEAESAAIEIARMLDLPGDHATAITTAALWHDIGKAHPAFQEALLRAAVSPPSGGGPWAKSDGKGRLEYGITKQDGTIERRPHFRHELASALAWLEHGERTDQRDLIAYLIAAHHGKVRTGLRALPDERFPEDGRRFARGVWEGDTLPAVDFGHSECPATTIRLDIMKLGAGPSGVSWTERTRQLLDTWGPFQLAWLETLVRIADWRASQGPQE